MGRRSIKANKNMYQLAREEAGLTRAQASELMTFVSESRIEKIESEKCEPHPEEIMAMANAYKKPALCNQYCSTECPIGREYVPQLESKDLSQIALETLSALNKLDSEKERIIEISADGVISDDELEDFCRIRKQLSQIALTVDSLQLWIDNAIANGGLDPSKLD